MGHGIAGRRAWEVQVVWAGMWAIASWHALGMVCPAERVWAAWWHGRAPGAAGRQQGLAGSWAGGRCLPRHAAVCCGGYAGQAGRHGWWGATHSGLSVSVCLGSSQAQENGSRYWEKLGPWQGSRQKCLMPSMEPSVQSVILGVGKWVGMKKRYAC